MYVYELAIDKYLPRIYKEVPLELIERGKYVLIYIRTRKRFLE